MSLSNMYAMSFRLAGDAYLDSVSVQLYVFNPPIPTVEFYLYNAVNSGGNPKPSNQIASITNIVVPLETNCVSADFGHLFLNVSQTYDNTFFIAIKHITGRTPEWKAITENSPPAAGYVYYYTGSDWVEDANRDCQLIVNIREFVLPSSVGLTVNGSAVSDISPGRGEWISSIESPASAGHVFYDVDSTWTGTVSLSYVWNATYARDTTATTNFRVGRDSDAFWNITVDATNAFPQTGTGVNHINITGIPSDWGDSSSMAYDGSNWVALDSHPPDTVSFPAGNDTWIVNCTAPNYLSSMGFMVGGTPVENATLNDVLDISVSFDSSVSGSATLSVYDPSQRLNYTSTLTLSGVTGTVFSWDVGSTATTDGTFNVTVTFSGGLMVGYNETALEIVPLIVTGLTVTSFPSSVEYPNTVSITVYYYDKGTGEGIAGASIVAYEGSEVLPIYNFTDHGNGTYSFVVDFGSDFGVHEVSFSASGLRFYATGVSDTVTINFKAPYYIVIKPESTGLILLMFSVLAEQNQSITRFLLVGAAVASVAAGGLVANRVRRRRGVPLRAMESLENIIVDHIPSGSTLWAFDFFKMEQDATLVSGFMSAVKTFLGEMKKGGLKKLETEFGTFIREEGNILSATCITSGVDAEEEKWIRERLRRFVSTAEQQNWDRLVDWKGEVSYFRASLLEILSSLIDLEKAEALQRKKIIKLLRERERLQEELNNLGSKLQELSQRYRERKISETDFEARKSQIEPKYEKIQMDYIRASIALSKVPYTMEAVWAESRDKEGIESIRDKFIEIRMEIDELQRKEREGTITTRELKRREKLRKDLTSLIKKLDKRQTK